MSKKALVAIGVVLGILILSGLGYMMYRTFFGGSGTIVVWTLKGNEGAVSDIGTVFHEKYRGYKVRIVPIPEQVYEHKALFALAAQGGSKDYPAPDVWIMPNEWFDLHANKLVAAPDSVFDKALGAYRASKESAAKFPAKGRSNTDFLKEDYAPIATNDLVRDGQVYGVPINMDTLAVFYDRTKISAAPKTWNEVVEYTKRFTIKQGDSIDRSVAALGDNQSVAHFLDILSILMLQNGTQMVDEAADVAMFNVSSTGATPPGTRALDFYTSFARAGKDTHTWDKKFGQSLRALKDEKTMMAFGYLQDLDDVGPIGQTKIAVATLPQVDPNRPQTYGRYLAAGVTKQAAERQLDTAAWNFAALFANPDVSEKFATTMRQVPARKDVAARMNLGPQYKAFQDQVGNATNWQKAEVNVANGALDEALRLVLDSKEDVQSSLDVASKAYTAFLRRDTGLETDPAVMTLWQSEDDTTDYKELIGNFLNKKEDIKRIAISSHVPQRYEWEILNAMAARLGPDLLFLPSDSVNRFSPTLRALPEGTFNTTNGNLDDLLALERQFVPAVVTDNVVDGRIYGMPINFETLMLAVNRPLMQDVRIAVGDALSDDYRKYATIFSDGPVTWEELKIMTDLGTRHTGSTIDLSMIALGTGENVAHADDIYAVLAKQLGGEVTDPDRLVTGVHLPVSSRDTTVPGKQALDYLRSFATPSASNYTWNASMPNSLEALATFKTVAAFIYPRDIAYLESINPELKLDLFALPQRDIAADPVDIANYYTTVIPKSARKPNDALEFVRAAVSDQNNNRQYNLPTLNNREVKVLDRRGDPQDFQKDSATSYYKGRYPDEIDQAFLDLLDGRFTLDQVANRINVSLKKMVL